jgi:glucose 1-dehydrogenase
MLAMTLAGKVALVTGANRGIGRGCALELARAGADVAVNYRSHAEEAGEVAAAVRALGRRAIVIQADVSDRAADEAMVERTAAELGRLDILVANAALSIRKPFLELSESDAVATFATTFWGAFHCAQFAAREMVRRGEGGAIVFIGSVHAVLPMRNSVPYNAAKAALNHMARTIASELAGARIRVNVVEPGWTDTPGERGFATEEQLREGAAHLPLARLGTSEEIGKAVAYLASDDAAYITGTVLRIDGGYTLLQR